MTKWEAMDVLGISYSTLKRYVKRGLIRTSLYQVSNKLGKMNYWDEDVYAMVGRRLESESKIVAYFRISLRPGSAERLQSQKDLVNKFCLARGITIDEVYEDKNVSGAEPHFKKRPAYHKLLQEVIKGNIRAIVVETPCRLSSFFFDEFEEICKYHGCDILVLNKVIEDPFYQEEQSEDIALVMAKAKMSRLKKSK